MILLVAGSQYGLRKSLPFVLGIIASKQFIIWPIGFGILTFFTFIDQSFIPLNEFNLQILLAVDLILLILFFSLIIYEMYKILKERRSKKLGSETSLRYLVLFSTTYLIFLFSINKLIIIDRYMVLI